MPIMRCLPSFNQSVVAVGLLLLFACEARAGEALDDGFTQLVSEYQLATVAAGIVRDGKLAWAGYYGERVPGEPADAQTMFNVGSVTKTVTTELALRMAAAGEISLDEPMFEYWIDPDIADDPRHKLLTPRMVLAHRTGFPNWRYMDPEFKLRFVSEPDTVFGYSGEGMDYLARFLERKSGTSFDALVRKYVIEPIGMPNTSIARRDWVVKRLVTPVDAAGNRHEPYCAGPDGRYCLDDGDWSAADELATTVEDFAVFLQAVMNGDGLSEELQQQRLSIKTSTAIDPVLRCRLDDAGRCPQAQGYGLGWEIFEFADETYVSHGGSDWSERAIIYFDPASRHGIILFLNGPSDTNVNALVEGMRLLDPESKLATLYEGWVEAYRALQAE